MAYNTMMSSTDDALVSAIASYGRQHDGESWPLHIVCRELRKQGEITHSIVSNYLES